MLKVSVVVVTYNEEKNIEACLRSLLAMDYKAEAYEILVVDGCSSDRTPAIVRKMAGISPKIRLRQNEARTIATNRNMGIREALHPYVAFTDADCTVPADWLRILAEAFQSAREECPDVAGVGGNNIPPGGDQNSFRCALGIMLNTFLGSLGSVQGKIYSRPRFVDSLACLNVMYEKKVLQEAGLFDPDMKNQGEDAELHFRMRQAGHRLLYVPHSFVYHRLRSTPRKWFVNMFNYGQGRVVLFRKHPPLLGFRYVLPLIFPWPFLLPFLSGFFGPVMMLPLAYFPLMLLWSLFVSVKKRHPELALMVFFCYLITHWAFSLGMWKKLFSGDRTM